MMIYNTLTRKKEKFVPIGSPVTVYACGPTVYNFIHIGNARPLCVFDVLRRYLEYSGFKVKFAQNFTDIDDKIIKRAGEEDTDFLSVSERFIQEYKTDATGLGIREADIHPRATENINEMLDIIEILLKKGHAYQIPCGDIYFSAKSFPNYGNLSRQNITELVAGARVELDENKNDPLDFALWKTSKPGEPSWDSPWGPGRPGWHIECSAMARRHLGVTIDIHCGGQDLIFPHHENEIAQSECCNGVKFANFWLHNGYINVNNNKMSKSLNNFFTVREIAEKYGYEPIRYLMVSSHYRSPINFNDEIIQQCVNSISRLKNFKENLNFIKKNQVSLSGVDITEDINKYKESFISFMEDDLNTAGALSSIFEMIKCANTHLDESELSKNSLDSLIETFDLLTSILGITPKNRNNSLDPEIEDLIAKRESARKNKDWELADKIRKILESKNIMLEDTQAGVKFKKIVP
ncbi:MAG: cysteine--tRNA ligase [Oscillospiraceae bacterium]|jgi:cysteinyl-tRNA synthetase|nr:cysteine--tRNA ligase [Oscillospiraceae bacterium]